MRRFVDIESLTSVEKIAFAREQNRLLKQMGFTANDAGRVIGSCGPGLAVEVAAWALMRIEKDEVPDGVRTVFIGLDPEYSRKRTKKTLELLGYDVGIPRHVLGSTELLDLWIAAVIVVATCQSLTNAFGALAFRPVEIPGVAREELGDGRLLAA